jgi:adenine phosphoribosyltransferase
VRAAAACGALAWPGPSTLALTHTLDTTRTRTRAQPETWQPTWSHDKILLGLLSFMATEERSTGTVVTTDEQKRAFAAASHAFNAKSKEFCRIFPELVVGAAPAGAAAAAAAAAASPPASPAPAPASAGGSSAAAAAAAVPPYASPALQLLAGAAGGAPPPARPQPAALPPALQAQLRGVLAVHPGFPRAGINFVDVLPLWRAPALLSATFDALARATAARFPAPHAPSFLAGVEARGFLLAPLALALGLPFVCVRKAGKLPGATRAAAYALEYGEAVLEVAEGCLPPGGGGGLLCDDLLATGGTLRCARALLEQLGGRVIGAVVLVELAGLGGAEALGLPVLAALVHP